MEKYLKGVVAKNILDVGPGYGNFSRLSAKITGATRIIYVDCDLSVLLWQMDECKKMSLEAESIQLLLDKNSLSRLQGSYDIILCQEVLEHLPNAEEVLIALSGHLSENGIFVITVPTKLSERWLKKINPSYMTGTNGHVREFDENALRNILSLAGLSPIVIIPTQPHYFLSHIWLFGSRVAIEESTGKILSNGVRATIGGFLTVYCRKFFEKTNFEWWGRIFPRNYFVVARRDNLR